MPNDVRYFDHGSDEAIEVKLQWHTIAVMLSSYYYLLIYIPSHSPFFIILCCKLLLPCLAAQLAYMMEDQLRGAAKEVDKEKALKEVATAKEKGTTTENVEERTRAAERA